MKRQQHGIALLEALLAILILAIGLIGALGMQSKAYSALAEAGMRAEATMASDRLLGLMSSDPNNMASYAVASGAAPGTRLATWYNETRAAIPNADISVTVTPAGATGRTQVDISIGWKRKATDKNNVHKITSYLALTK